MKNTNSTIINVDGYTIEIQQDDWRWFFRLDNLAVRVFPKKDEI